MFSLLSESIDRTKAVNFGEKDVTKVSNWIQTQARSGRSGRINRNGARMLFSWMKLAVEMNRLAVESQIVIWTRLTQIARGRGTPAESILMVTEKVAALAEASATVATGGSAQKVVKGYRKRVRANVRRLRR